MISGQDCTSSSFDRAFMVICIRMAEDDFGDRALATARTEREAAGERRRGVQGQDLPQSAGQSDAEVLDQLLRDFEGPVQ